MAGVQPESVLDFLVVSIHEPGDRAQVGQLWYNAATTELLVRTPEGTWRAISYAEKTAMRPNTLPIPIGKVHKTQGYPDSDQVWTGTEWKMRGKVPPFNDLIKKWAIKWAYNEGWLNPFQKLAVKWWYKKRFHAEWSAYYFIDMGYEDL